ncbi:MAG: hypothetical protein DMF63_17915 [Acidobacteria bacterium]|nr:MAG: hypothetical protein DMF63_17915 [Acidobacteriota bacterium]
MAGEIEENAEPEWLKNLPIRSEEIGFAPEELVPCPNCGRANDPNRKTCLYCGAPAPGAEYQPEIRKVEEWENGFNLVLIDAAEADVEKAADTIVEIASGDKEFFRSAFESGRRIPIMRTASSDESHFVSEKLREVGIETSVVDDASLKTASPPTRLRSINFEDERVRLGLFNRDETFPIAYDSIVVIVIGSIIEQRNESVERRKMKSSKTLNEAETSSDELVIDIYSSHDPLGWRIPSTGFDFSCLGAEKSLLVADNMKTLIGKLVALASRAKLIDDYSKVQSLIEVIWPSDVKRDSNILGFRQKDLSTVLTTSNALQFTKYSRMQWRLLYEEKV